jgi:hypothetical protein
MAYENLKSLTSASENGNNEPVGSEAKPKRGRRKTNSDTTIAKSEGHKLANEQKIEAAEFVSGLEKQEQILTAAKGYQFGQNLAKIEEAARVAGIVDTLTDSSLSRIAALRLSLQDGLTNHDPLAVLDELGLRRTGQETADLREKIAQYGQDGQEDLTRFLL